MIQRTFIFKKNTGIITVLNIDECIYVSYADMFEDEIKMIYKLKKVLIWTIRGDAAIQIFIFCLIKSCSPSLMLMHTIL